jgi:hypothetical protein
MRLKPELYVTGQCTALRSDKLHEGLLEAWRESK